MRTAIAIIAAVLLCTGCKTATPLGRARDTADRADSEYRAALAQVTDVARRATLHFDLQGAEPGTAETQAASAAALAVAEVAGSPLCPLDDWREPSGAIEYLRESAASKRLADADLAQEQAVVNESAPQWRARATRAEKGLAAMQKSVGPFVPVLNVLYWLVMGAIIVAMLCGAGFNYLTKRVIRAVGFGAGGLALLVAWYFHGRAWLAWSVVGTVAVAVGFAAWHAYQTAAAQRLIDRIQAWRHEASDEAKEAFDAFMSGTEGQPNWVRQWVARIKRL